MIKYIEDLFYSIEYHFLSAFWPYKKFEVGEIVDKAVEYCLQHHVKYNVGENSEYRYENLLCNFQLC